MPQLVIKILERIFFSLIQMDLLPCKCMQCSYRPNFALLLRNIFGIHIGLQKYLISLCVDILTLNRVNFRMFFNHKLWTKQISLNTHFALSEIDKIIVILKMIHIWQNYQTNDSLLGHHSNVHNSNKTLGTFLDFYLFSCLG